MKNLLKIGFGLLLAAAAAIGFVACGSDDKVEEAVKVVLTPSKTSMISDGADAVTFTVKYGSDDVTSGAVVYNQTTGEQVSGSFTTSTEGTYSFYAEYNNVRSDAVSVTAIATTVSQGLVISANKYTFTPDNVDQIVFTVTNNGVNVTSEASIKNVTDNTYLDGNIFTSSLSKPIVINAIYDGAESENIMIKPEGLGFFHKVAMFRFTGTWCYWCGVLSDAIATIQDEIEDYYIVSNIHASDIYQPSNAILRETESAYGPVPGYPYCNMDMVISFSGAVTAKKFKENLEDRYSVSSATGIKAMSSVSGTTANVDIEVWANTANTYYVGAHLLEDGLVGTQTGSSNSSNYTHNDVLRAIQGGAKGTSIGQIAADGKGTVSYSFDLSSYVADNCHIMIYVTKIVDNAYVVDNAIDVPVNGSVDYAFAK